MTVDTWTRRITAWAALAVIFAAGQAAAQSPVQSFMDVPRLVRVGQRVIVRDDAGGTLRATITAVTPDRLEVRYRTWRFQQRAQAFNAPSVRSIAIVDSTWNGQLIGLAAGVFGAWAINKSCNNDSCIGSALAGVVLAPVAGLFIGEAIDRSVNRLVYVAPRKGIVTVTPFLTPGAVAVVARVH